MTAEERATIIGQSPIGTKYDTPVDRESAYERLQGRVTTVADEAPRAPWGAPGGAPQQREDDPWGLRARPASAPTPTSEPSWMPPAPRYPASPMTGAGGGILGGLFGSQGGRQGVGEAMVKSIARSLGSQVGTQVGRAVLRGVLGSILKR